MSIKDAWENYAKKYNILSNLLVEVGIDLKLLRELIEATKELYKLKN